ncbi:MAG TPA: PDZ domain-containing protein, partial [Acetobacteraceae bacterium]|nr:PDZ domain-containing protein [Acetobacteraceae bacterium]
SAEGRDLGSSPFDSFLQLDAPINPGNSGGPIFDMNGEVIGVSTAIVSPSGGSVGIGFAIPSDTVRRTVAELLAHGTIARGWLGVAIEDSTAGVRIASIEPGGPAAHSGLRPGDVVVAIDGERINSSRGLIRAVAATPPGGTARLTVHRDGHVVDLPVTVGRRPPESSG